MRGPPPINGVSVELYTIPCTTPFKLHPLVVRKVSKIPCMRESDLAFDDISLHLVRFFNVCFCV